MRANVDRHGDRLASERLLAGLSGRLGKHAAQQVMHEALRPGSSDARRIVDALVGRGCRHRGGVPRLARPARDGCRRRDGRHRCRPGSSGAGCGAGHMAVTLPRIRLATLPTPLVRARRLESTLSAGPIYLKRDDLTGFGIAGNKARALEFLVGDAVEQRADLLVAAGSPRSNFCAAAAMAARTVGLACHLLFSGPPTRAVVGDRRAGQGVRRDGCTSTALRRASSWTTRCSPTPRGCAPRVGDRMPCPAAARPGSAPPDMPVPSTELADQCVASGVTPALVVVATGSGGTQAGLVAGQVGFGLPGVCIGASVSRPPDEAAAQVLRAARGCAELLALDPCDLRRRRDPRLPRPGLRRRLGRRPAQHTSRPPPEALLLDDYYGAKALSLLPPGTCRRLPDTGRLLAHRRCRCRPVRPHPWSP